METSFRVIIPAGGKSSRSGLSYPKTLYKLDRVPILIRILQVVEPYDRKPIVVINPSHISLFEQVLKEYGKEAELVMQNEPKGMGDAILRTYDKIDNHTSIILIWSDIPLLSKITLQHLVNCHLVRQNNFSMVTSIGSNCYTIVERENGLVMRVKETRALGIEPAKEGEREIGVFVFQKQPALEILKKDSLGEYNSGIKEHGFLYVIEKLVAEQKRVEGFPIALPSDILSFNTPQDLAEIEKTIAANCN